MNPIVAAPRPSAAVRTRTSSRDTMAPPGIVVVEEEVEVGARVGMVGGAGAGVMTVGAMEWCLIPVLCLLKSSIKDC